MYEGGEGQKEKFQGRVARPDEAHLIRVSLECLRCTSMCVEGIQKARLVEDEQIESCDWREYAKNDCFGKRVEDPDLRWNRWDLDTKKAP